MIASMYYFARFSTLFFCFVCVVPVQTFAASQLLISEIHYNPVGTDDKHEYIEVCNVGADAQDISGYKLYESSSNHGLTLNRGSSTLAKDACAVFVIDPATFMADFPTFSATLFDVSFSLSNTGEALILRDANGADVDGVSYAPAQGGNGDGKSLHRSGTVFVAGSPSPGSEAGLVGTGTGAGGGSGTGGTGTGTGSTDTNSTPADTTTPPSVTTIFHTVTIEPPAQLFVRTQSKVETATGSVVTFSAEAYNAKGGAEDAQYTWVYGDGLRDASTNISNKTAPHVYKHAGEYEAVVTATRGGLSAEARVRVVVTDSQLALSFMEDDTLVVLENKGAVPVDLTGMRLTNNSQVYTFPDKTRVLPKQKLTLTLTDIGFSDHRMPREVTLLAADGRKKVTAVGAVPVPETVVTASSRPLAPMTVLGYGQSVSTGLPLAAASFAQSSVTQKVVAAAQPVINTKAPLPRKKVVARATSPLAVKTSGITVAESASTNSNGTTNTEVAVSPETQTASLMQSGSGIPTWLLLIVGTMLLGTGIFASWVIGKNPS